MFHAGEEWIRIGMRRMGGVLSSLPLDKKNSAQRTGRTQRSRIVLDGTKGGCRAPADQVIKYIPFLASLKRLRG